MSELIRKIAVKTDAWCDQHYLGNQSYDIEWEQKFAQLIVAECLDIADEYDGVGSTIVSRIREHFGVEYRAVPILSTEEQALFAGIASSKLFTIAGAKKHFGVEE